MTAVDHYQSDDQFVDQHLQGTSRTFALAIPLLASERRLQIGVSYLLFRVADSIEDAPKGDSAVKKRLLIILQNCLSEDCVRQEDSVLQEDFVRQSAESRFAVPGAGWCEGLWPAQSPTQQLLRDFPTLWSIFAGLPPQVSRAIGKSLSQTITGMIHFLDASRDLPTQIQIQSVSELRLYCYAVAGIVGELLTEIFAFHHPAAITCHSEMRALSVGFGEFLQLINILKDSGRDATSGRVFIPLGASRESICELAMAGRDDALTYIRLLEKHDFPADIIHYCRFLFLLADGSLRKLREGGAGSKLTRDEVMQIFHEVKSESFVQPV
jgi:farnesyl-diphosphate farnesyltransferase